ncbi:hypothetical protein H4219_004300 [Mycoemilia scoparia]|uniref:Uncharacterized protein n=1 Tax=Mycoemilia scoparia TaxID=417184 RepID=A0A9W7ZWL7_9FUNG|nr:hypothetical protein H4219_004300 [Mycoemilia scoparia]
MSQRNGGGDDRRVPPDISEIFNACSELLEHTMFDTFSRFEKLFTDIAQEARKSLPSYPPNFSEKYPINSKYDSGSNIVKPPTSSEIFTGKKNGDIAGYNSKGTFDDSYSNGPQNINPIDGIFNSIWLPLSILMSSRTISDKDMGDRPFDVKIIEEQHHDIEDQIDHIGAINDGDEKAPGFKDYGSGLRRSILKPGFSNNGGKGFCLNASSQIPDEPSQRHPVDYVRSQLPGSIFDEGVISSMRKPITFMLDQMWHELVVDKIDHALESFEKVSLKSTPNASDLSPKDGSQNFWSSSSVTVSTRNENGVITTKRVETFPDGTTKTTETTNSNCSDLNSPGYPNADMPHGPTPFFSYFYNGMPDGSLHGDIGQGWHQHPFGGGDFGKMGSGDDIKQYSTYYSLATRTLPDGSVETKKVTTKPDGTVETSVSVAPGPNTNNQAFVQHNKDGGIYDPDSFIDQDRNNGHSAGFLERIKKIIGL